MYVCVCNAVTEDDIRREAEQGVRGFAELQMRTGCATSCGCCEEEARRLLESAHPMARKPPVLRIIAA